VPFLFIKKKYAALIFSNNKKMDIIHFSKE